MKNKRKYEYVVFYKFKKNRFSIRKEGNGLFLLEKKINNYDKIISMARQIMKKKKYYRVIITNFILLKTYK
jgi:hypothetical protein